MICCRVSGKDADKAFINEGGCHRWQRVSPTEKRGRTHTSTITVAILSEPTKINGIKIKTSDLEIKATRGSGPGGQHRNKTDSAIQLKHKPSGIMVRCESEKSQKQNKENAIRILKAKLLAQKIESELQKTLEKRRKQVGKGLRGEKIRTVRMQDGIVIDGIKDRKLPLKNYLKGELDSFNK